MDVAAFRPRRAPTSGAMLIALLHCSDPGCDAEVELVVEDLRELDGWPCDCGCGLILGSVAELIALS